MARGGGRGGGGSRGGGFGGSRGGGFGGSSRGRSGGFGGSSRGRGGGSFGNRGGGSFGGLGGGWGNNNNRRPVIRTGPIFNSWGSNRRRNYGGGPYGGGGGSGCGSMIGILVFIGILLFFVIPMFTGGSGNSGGSSNSIAPSTVEREPLPAGSVNETEYYTDEANWVENHNVMIDGLRHFYDETGVQPHVYITTEINGSRNASDAEIEEFTQDLYDELFTDEAHLLLMFYEPRPGDYTTYYVPGMQANQVIDNEAASILFGYIDRYYYDSSLNTSEFFSKSFRDAADRIMEVTTSPWIPVFLVIGGVIILGILFFWWRKRQQNEAMEAKRTEEILNRPIDTFGAPSDADELAKKYSDDETQ